MNLYRNIQNPNYLNHDSLDFLVKADNIDTMNTPVNKPLARVTFS